MTYPIDPCTQPTPPIDDCRSEAGDITEREVKCAQQEWCRGLLDISAKYNAKPRGPYFQAARDFIRRFYDFGPGGRVFFRPTLAVFPDNFRTTFDGTLEYFVGDENEPDAPEGFAKANFFEANYSNRVDTEATAIQRFGNTAVAMGNVCLKEKVIIDDREVIKDTVVDKAFVYRKDRTDNNQLKLIVHMSAKRNSAGEAAVE